MSELTEELTDLRNQAASCTACELHAGATQTVFGAGRPGASIVLAGEQPGDQEDRQRACPGCTPSCPRSARTCW